MSGRVSTARLLELGAGLSAQERELVKDLMRLRLASHRQLAVLLGLGQSEVAPTSAARQARRVLARLTEQRVLARLSRRIGGLRAGSSGFVYYLGPVGQRLVAYWNGEGLTRGRFRPEPGSRYVRHRLAVSALYVELRSSERRGESELIEFQPEPDCWRSYLDGLGGRVLIKPDAFLRLGVGAYEERAFVEVDLATESRSVVARKLKAYWWYFQTGTEQAESGVFPRVLLFTNTDERKSALIEVCERLPAEAWQLFTVAKLGQALEVLVAGGQDSGAAL
jgi:Replication-relaxation